MPSRARPVDASMASSSSAPARWPAWAVVVALAAAYFLTARLGLSLAMPGGHVTPVWPPSGVALAALVLCGRRVWPGIWLGSFAANLWDFAGAPAGLAAAAATSATLGAGASAAALIGACLLSRRGGPRTALARVRGVWELMALGGAMSCLVSATVGTTALYLGGFAPASAYGQVWLTWWLGDTAGVFVVAPLLLAWHRSRSGMRWLRGLEAAGCFGVLIAATWYVFVQSTPPFSGRPLAFVILPLLVWPAVRFGARGAATAVAVMAALAVWGTIHGAGPFASGTRNESLLMLELFLSVAVLTALCIAAIVAERQQAEAAQQQAFDELEVRVAERTAELGSANRKLRSEIAARSRSEALTARNQTLLTETSRMANVGGWELSADTRQLWCSEQVCSILEVAFNPQALLLDGLGFYTPACRPIIKRAVRAAFDRAEPFDLELEIVTAKGRVRWVRTVGKTDRVRRVVCGAFQDITERKQSEVALLGLNAELEDKVRARTVELMQARDDAQQASRAKSVFLAAMSHEIRTPMNGVVGMIDVLEKSHLKPTQMEVVQVIRESARALLSIVDDVLDFSKIEAGLFQVDREPMDVAAVVEGTCDTLDHMARTKDVQLTLFTDPAIPRQVLGDAARLRQVLLNLTGNAIKFSSASDRVGRVCVRACLVSSSPEPPVLEFSVADNGIGMDQETLSQLFTPFTQADAGTTRRFGGTGLGLSISHRLAELMGGRIAVRSEPGLGSTFSVRLPMATAGASSGSEGHELAGLRCLVWGGLAAADLSAYLSHDGAVVEEVADAAAAREWFGHCPPGLWIGVIASADTVPDQTLAELRAVCRARPDLEARLVVIEHGRQRNPRGRVDDLVSLDGGGLHRSVFLKAVALAAGRVTADAVQEAPSFDADTMPAPLSLQEAGAQGRLILVAEDNEINQKVLRKQLALLGFTAHINRNGREALECLRRRDYPLLLTDLHMPQMDGYALTAAIRGAESGRRRMPIVALTANALKGEARRCLGLGMDDYMTKPVQLEDLKAVLHKWLPPTAADTPAGLAPNPDAAPAGSMAVDVRMLEDLVGDELPVIAGLLQDFRLSACDAATQMRNARRADDAAAVGEVAHRLKSSACSIGALRLGELCARLEHSGRTGNLDALAEQWPAFEAEMNAVDDCLSAWRAKVAPHLSRMGDLP